MDPYVFSHKTCISIPIVNVYFLLYPSPGELPQANATVPPVTTAAPTVQPHSCPDGEFVCGAHGECVPQEKVCDFRHDCSDGSDEMDCGKVFYSLRFTAVKQTEHFLSLTCLLLSLLSSSLLYQSVLRQWRRGVNLRAVKRAVGRPSTPLRSRSMHFAGPLTKEKAFMMESSTTVLSMTTPCEYHQKHMEYLQRSNNQ